MSADHPGGAEPGDSGFDVFKPLTTRPKPDGQTRLRGADFARPGQPPAAVPGQHPPGPHPPAPRLPRWRVPGPYAPGLLGSGLRVPRLRVPGLRLSRPRGRRALWIAACVAGVTAAGAIVALDLPGATAAHPSAGPGSARARTHAPSPAPGGQHRSPAQPAKPVSSASPRSGPSATAGAPAEVLSITVSSDRIVADTSEQFTGSLTEGGQAVPGASLSLQERAPGQSAFRRVASTTTGPDGAAAVTVSDLTTNALFQLAGPGGVVSQQVQVIVVPPISATLAAGPPGQDFVLIASSPLAAPGDPVVLQLQSGSAWVDLRQGRLDASDLAGFPLPPQPVQRYRVELLATATHGLSVSNTVTAGQ